MFVDGRELESGTEVEADVCIVGAGFAGIALAMELMDSKLSVALLESGGFQESPKHEALLEGTFDGPHKNKNYLHTSRSRYFGGTSAKWLGICRPLDPIDFEHRPWVADSGWPFDHRELVPYYDRAAPVLGIRPFKVYDRDGQLAPSNFLAGREITRFVPKVLYRKKPIVRFGDKYRKQLKNAENTTVYLHANVVELETTPDGASIQSAIAKNFADRQIRFKARHFVLAAGAFDIVRLLLTSNRHHAEGLGNAHDQVGRRYMDHTRLPQTGLVMQTEGRPRRWHSTGSASVPGGFSYVMFSPTLEAQRQLQMLNCGVRLMPLDDDTEQDIDPGTLARDVGGLARGLDQTVTSGADPMPRTKIRFTTKLYNEHIPLAHSRVRLDTERDALGQLRLVVEWRSNRQMDRSVERTLELLAMELGRTSRGRLRLALTDPLYGPPSFLGSHPMGMTCMHPDPKKGVVDAECKVHGLENLFIAGSSVFPTGGFVNPTHTIVALALRIGESLRRRLESVP